MRRQFLTRSHRDLAATFDVGRPGLHAQDVVLVHLELLGVLDGDDALVGRMNDDSTGASSSYQVPVPPETTAFSRPTTQA
jgi:hypothetical protein